LEIAKAEKVRKKLHNDQQELGTDTKVRIPLTLEKRTHCKTLTIYIPTPSFFSG
jgi:hypothetical protein